MSGSGLSPVGRWFRRIDDEGGGRRYGRGPGCCVLCVVDLVGTQHEHIEEVRWLNWPDNKAGNLPAASMVMFMRAPCLVVAERMFSYSAEHAFSRIRFGWLAFEDGARGC